MAKQEQDNTEILLRCECSGYHFVEIFRDPDFGNSLWITHIAQPKTISQRLQIAWQALFSNETVFEADIIVDKKDFSRLAKYFAQQAKKHKTVSETSLNADQKEVD